jgi:hypothetical protein
LRPVESLASVLYTMKKGVNPVDRFVLVRKLHSTAGTLLAKHPANLLRQLKKHGFRPCRTMPLACSICSLVRACVTEAQPT